MDKTGDHHVECDKPNIACSCSFVEPRFKTVMMVVVIMVMMIKGHECERGSLRGD
jgi:hypothetical protein